MKAILDNPYRIAGLLVGATAREQERQINKLKRYLEAGQKPPQDDNSFPVLGKLNRTLDTVEDAASKLHLNSDKMDAAIFWFYDNNTDAVDPAIEALKISGSLYASTIWSKKTTRVKIAEDNCSAFQNFSTLLLCQCLRNKPVNKTLLEQGIYMKLQFLDSDFVKELKSKATDETYKTTKETVQLSFLNILQREIEQSGEISNTQWIDIISKYEFSAKEEYLNNYIQKLIEQIERKIETTQDRRGTEKANAADAGNELYGSTKDMLIQLQSLLGISNIKYSSIADKVANEILQCGIDYFNYYNDTETDPSKLSMDLFNQAKTLSVGNLVKGRVDENIKVLQKWIDYKPEREKRQKVKADLEFIDMLLQRFQKLSDTNANVKDLVESCKPKLNNIKKVLGQSDDLYLKYSTAVAGNALGMLVSTVNAAQNGYPAITGDYSSLRSIVLSAIEVFYTIGTLDMTAQQRTHYSTNYSTLKSIASQLGVFSYSEGFPYSSASTNSSITKNNNKWYHNPKDWGDFGGWWCTKAADHAARGSSVNQGCGFGMVWLILIPFNLLVGIIYVLYLFVAWIMRNTSNDK